MAVVLTIISKFDDRGVARAQKRLAAMGSSARGFAGSTAADMVRAGAAMDAVGQKMQRVGRGMTMGITLPLAVMAGAAVKTAADFNGEMRKIQTQAGGTASDVKVLSEQILAFRDAQQGPQELAKAMYHLKSVGMDNVAAMNALRTASAGAAVGGSDLEETASALAAAWRTGIRGATTFKGSMGTVNAIVGAGNMRMEDLVGALSTGVLPAAKSVGLSFKDVGTALAVMTDQGVPAQAAATRLRMTFSMMAAPTAKAADAMKSVGLKSTDLANAMRQKGLIGALELLKQHLAGLSKVKQTQVISQMFGGGRTSSAIITLLQSLDVAKEKYKQISDQSRSFAAAAETQAKGFNAEWARFRSSMQRAGVAMGTTLMPYARKLLDTIGRLAGSFATLTPKTRGTIVAVAAVAAAFGPLTWMLGSGLRVVGFWTRGLGNLALAFGKNASAAPLWARTVAGAAKGVGSLAKGIGQIAAGVAREAVSLAVDTAKWVAHTAAVVAARAAQLAAAAASKVWAAAQWLLNVAMDANPIGLVVIAIAALVGAFILAWKKSETFRRIVLGAWSAIKSATVSVFGAVVSFFKTWGPRILTVLAGPLGVVVRMVIQHWSQIKAAAAAAFNAVVSFARSFGGRIKGAVGSLGHLLYSVGEDIVRGLVSGIGAAWHWVTDKLHSLVSGLSSVARKALGINSPSKVFAKIGGSVGEGMASGIRSWEGTVRRASLNLSRATLPAGGPPGGFTVGSPRAGSSTVLQVLPGAVQVSFAGSPGGSVSEHAIDAKINLAFRRLAAELKRR